VKQNKTMRTLSFIWIFPFCLLLASCSRNSLPPIKDAETLHKDCTILYEEFPTQEIPTNHNPYDFSYKLLHIPKEKWPPSIVALNPDRVDKNIMGILIFPKSGHERARGGDVMVWYFVLVNQNKIPPPSNFKPTDFDNIYKVSHILSDR